MSAPTIRNVRPITVQFLKNPDHIHWGFEALWLGEDEHGSWAWVPAGSRRWKGPVVYPPTPSDAVFCAPHDGWWHLHYNGPESKFSHFVDITTPPRWVGAGRYEMIDLDLDVTVDQAGAIDIEDEDEFEVHQVEYSYTHDMIARALAETRFVVTALEQRAEPFFEVAADWLGRGRASYPTSRGISTSARLRPPW